LPAALETFFHFLNHFERIVQRTELGVSRDNFFKKWSDPEFAGKSALTPN
jgi:hypothetical protein